MKSGLAPALLFALHLLTPLTRAQQPGDVDSLNLNIPANFGNFVAGAAVQPDGKALITGRFGSVLGVSRQNVARLNPNGTLETGFDPKANNVVYSVVVQADGKVLLGGAFTTLQPNGAATPITRRYIARVNADGTLDTAFNPNPNAAVTNVTMQPDAKVLLGGLFSTLQPNGAASPTSRSSIARLNADGSLDTGFDPKTDGPVYSMAVEGTGSVILGGQFTTLQPNGAVSPITRKGIARVNADGTLDMDFDPNVTGNVYSVVGQADGKVLLGGVFLALQPNGAASFTPRNHIARVNADGTLDMGFNPNANERIYSVSMQVDGKVLLGGNFTSLQPNGAASPTARRYVARVNADGALDTRFDPHASDTVYSITVQADGKVLLGGLFGGLMPNGTSGIVRNHFARLYNNPATQTLSAPAATQVLWQRGGASPEVSGVTFELSTDGGANWSLLGAGSRIGTTANWDLTSLALPASALFRSRGVTNGGYYNGGSGLVEAIMSVEPGKPIEAWRQSYFGAGATNSGDAADIADPDHDGLTNLDEYARNTSPLVPTSNPAPVFNAPTFTFARNIAASDISFRVEATDALSPAAWTPIATRGAGTTGWTTEPGVSAIENDAGFVTITDSVAPGAVSQRFLRLVVTHP